MAKRKVGNPLALAVLCLLLEKPMHPYEMAFTLRSRHKHESIKLNYGSLYTVVDALERSGLVEVRDVVREGRRPERTVYGLTAQGRDELYNWMADLVSHPAKEYPQFATALSLIAVLPPARAVGLLERRAGRLEREIEEARFGLESLVKDIPRLFIIEAEYELALKEAELAFVRRLLADIEAERLSWPDEVQRAYEREAPEGDDEEEAGQVS